MKYLAALLLVGAITTADALEIGQKELVRLNTEAYTNSSALDSESESESDSDEMNVQLNQPCVYLDETQDELDYQVDMFSRTLDPRHWTNVLNISKAMTKKTGQAPKLQVHTWELYDKSFSFPRVRRYNFVQENMDMLEHFQDNLNTNISNSVHMENFLRVAQTVRGNFNEKYHDGEFADPALVDPRELEDEK